MKLGSIGNVIPSGKKTCATGQLRFHVFYAFLIISFSYRKSKKVRFQF